MTKIVERKKRKGTCRYPDRALASAKEGCSPVRATRCSSLSPHARRHARIALQCIALHCIVDARHHTQCQRRTSHTTFSVSHIAQRTPAPYAMSVPLQGARVGRHLSSCFALSMSVEGSCFSISHCRIDVYRASAPGITHSARVRNIPPPSFPVHCAI
eukprot:3072741-Rhodomonas_salina.1